MKTLFEHSIITKNSDLLTENIEGGGVILFDNNTKQTHLLNETGMLAFNLCENKTFNLIRKEFVSMFEDIGNITEIENDLIELINMFLQQNICFITE